MPPNQLPNDPVWLSREEYDRLRQQAAYNQAPLIVPAPPAAKTHSALSVVATIAGIGLLLALTTHLYIVFILSLPVLVVVTIVALIRSYRAKGGGGLGANKLPVILATILIVLFIGALVVSAPFVLFLFVMMSGGGIG